MNVHAQDIAAVERERARIFEQLARIRSMQRGALTGQMLAGKRKQGGESKQYGPYYVLTRWEDGKTRSRRVKAGEIAQVKADLERGKEFERLCEELARLTERLGELEREAGPETLTAEKKTPKSPRTPKPK